MDLELDAPLEVRDPCPPSYTVPDQQVIHPEIIDWYRAAFCGRAHKAEGKSLRVRKPPIIP